MNKSELVIAIVCLLPFINIISGSGDVLAWGGGGNGQLGNADTDNAIYPTSVLNISNIIAVASGSQTCYALDTSDHVWAWGNGSGRQLGNGIRSYSSIPVQVSNISNILGIASSDNTAYALDNSGHVWSWGAGSFG